MLLAKILAQILPTTCVLCSVISPRSIGLCHQCEIDLPWLTTTCKICAVPLMAVKNDKEKICGQCLQHKLAFSAVTALFHYQPPIDNFIMALKFHQQLLYARLLGELLAMRLQQNYHQQALPELIIPVPLHPQRLRERGFNQALEIARPIAKKLNLPLDINHCERIRATSTQSLLPANQRQDNVKSAFKVMRALAVKHVAIIDDVITTGHTVNEFSQTLRHAGVERIDVWSVARTNIHV